MDLADNTPDFNEGAVKKFQAQKKVQETRGVCLSCEEQIASDQIFCDPECREQHERTLRIRSKTYSR